MQIKLVVLSFILACSFSVPGTAQQTGRGTVEKNVIQREKPQRFYSTELYLGRSIPGGNAVSEEDWEKFLSEIVTPLFPSGFTVLNGRGQWREASGKIAREPTNVLVFLYPRSERKAASDKIEKIRTAYQVRFNQEAVLRVDVRKTVLVSF